MLRIFWLIICILSGPALAQTDAPLQRLLSASEAKDWEAVGRINMEGAGFCTGTLIAERLVLTAAHCMFYNRTGVQIPPEKIHFLAGWRLGRAAAHRKARRVVIHGGYDFAASEDMARVGNDIALIELDQPIHPSMIEPFERYGNLLPGDEVMVVSYARERAEVPALQSPCHMLGRQDEILLLSCDVNYGASGSPVFAEIGGKLRVVSVVSAMAQWKSRSVALGASLGTPLESLMARLRTTNGVFKKLKPGQPNVEVQSTGAKVIRMPSAKN